MIYMDYNATAPVNPEVLEACLIFCQEKCDQPPAI